MFEPPSVWLEPLLRLELGKSKSTVGFVTPAQQNFPEFGAFAMPNWLKNSI